MSTIKIGFTRSREWVKQQAVERAADVPERAETNIYLSDLSRETRRLILDYVGSSAYPEYLGQIKFGSDYLPSYHANYGRHYLRLDAEKITAADADRIINQAFQEIAAKRTVHLEEQAAREAKEAAEREAQAKREADLAAARELLKDDLAKLDHYRQCIRTLGDFLSRVPDDALRGTLRAIASGDEAIAALQQKVDEASLFAVVFNDDDDTNE